MHTTMQQRRKLRHWIIIQSWLKVLMALTIMMLSGSWHLSSTTLVAAFSPLSYTARPFLVSPLSGSFLVHSRGYSCGALQSLPPNKQEEQADKPEGDLMVQPASDSTMDNDTPIGRFLRGLVRTGMKDTVNVNAIVIAKADIQSLGIWMDQSYELQSIYLQGLNPETNLIEKISLETLTDEATATRGYTKYIKLYSPMYHKERGPVVVTPEEVGLISLRDEVLDSILFALPVLAFWTTTAFMFAKTYNERYGGNFIDALFRT
jgi:hypothetical protein